MAEPIDEILAGLESSRPAMQRQVATIDEILEKSNKTLLLVEGSNNNGSSSSSAGSSTYCPGQRTVNYNPEYELALAKILVNFQQMVQQKTVPDVEGQVSLLDDCLAYQQRVEYLGSSVRKLKALCDTIQQVCSQVKVEMQPEDHDDSDKENISADNFSP